MVQTKTGIFEAMAQESSQYRMLSTQDEFIFYTNNFG